MTAKQTSFHVSRFSWTTSLKRSIPSRFNFLLFLLVQNIDIDS